MRLSLKRLIVAATVAVFLSAIGFVALYKLKPAVTGTAAVSTPPHPPSTVSEKTPVVSPAVVSAQIVIKADLPRPRHSLDVEHPSRRELAREERAKEKKYLGQEFQLGRAMPAGWLVHPSDAADAMETAISFEVPGHPGIEPSVHYRKFSEPMIFWSTDVRAWLDDTAEAKAAQRVREGLADYHNRPEKTPRIIGNRAALSWSAEFTRDGVPWVENLTRLFSPAGTALYFVKAPASEINDIQPRFDIIIESTVMPSAVTGKIVAMPSLVSP